MKFFNWFKKKKFEKDYNIFFDNNKDMLCIANANGYFLKLNKAFVDKLGYLEKELYSKKFLDFVHPDDVEQTLNDLHDVSINLKTSGVCTNRYITGNNECIRLQWNYFNMNNKLYCIIKDITEEYKLDCKLKRYKDLLEKSEDIALIGCWQWNINTNELIWTDGLKKIYNISEVSYENYMSKNHPDDIPFLNETIDTCVKNKNKFSISH